MGTNLELCLAEGWELNENSNIVVDGKEYPICHPYQIYLTIYKNTKIPILKLHAMEKVHDYLWPHLIITKNDWQHRIFEAHCYDYRQVVLSSGAGAGKSLVAAMVAVIFWLASPKNRAVVISSTTLDSLESRIWGYAIRLLHDAQIPIAFHNTGSKPPKVVFPGVKNKLAGMFAVAIREGSDARSISTSIGKHPDGGLLVVLDEATEIAPAFLKALPNLEQGVPYFQLIAIGNASSKHDVHGGLATPHDGWNTISPYTHNSWRTCQDNSICIYFNPYTSPAILETNPEKKAALSQFLITKEKMDELGKRYGTDSDSYWRFVLGFWQTNNIEEVIITEEFLKESNVTQFAEWSGLRELTVVGGLDPAISSGKRGCVLQIGILGHTTNGKIVLDFRGDSLLHYIDIQPQMDVSPEMQLTNQVLEIMSKYGLTLYNLAIDATGLGRAVGDLLKLKSQSTYNPVKILSTRGIHGRIEKDIDTFTQAPLELWTTVRNFIQHGQLKGISHLTSSQLSNRKLLKDRKTGRTTLETKPDYMSRMSAINPAMAHSPNEADALALCLQAAMIRHNFSLGQEIRIEQQGDMFNEKYAALMAERRYQERMSQVEEVRRPASPTASFSSPLTRFASRNRSY